MTDALVISTPRLRMRPIAAADFPHWRLFYSSEHSHFVGGPKSEEDAWWKVASFIGHWAMTGFGYWSVTTTEGEYLGRVGLEQPIGWPEPELGWSFLPEAGGKGYATEAAAAVRTFERARLGVTDIISYVHLENAASARVAKRVGAWHDADTAAIWDDHLVYRHPAEGAA